jgi:hypothetical protein
MQGLCDRHHIELYCSTGSGLEVHITAMIYSAKKCFFRTERGYMKTAPDPLPDRITSDDMIVIVTGLEMLLLIRPKKYVYQLVTRVYLHRVVYGEKWPESDGELEEVVLL